MSTDNSSESVQYVFYHYTPSLPAAIVAIVVFALLTILHTWRMFRARTWFCIPFVLGGLFEAVGYIGRAIGHYDNQARNPYIIQSVLILVAPALFAATIYMTLGRMMRAVNGEKYSIIRVNWLTKFFVVGDVLSFFVQSGGAGIMAGGSRDKMELGENIILGGLFLQIVWFGLFLVAAIVFHFRMQKYPTSKSYDPEIGWRKMIWCLYIVSVLILLRNIVRAVEFIGGNNGYLFSIEWPIYVFDALLMALMMGFYGWWYPTLFMTRGHYSVESADSSPADPADIESRPRSEKP